MIAKAAPAAPVSDAARAIQQVQAEITRLQGKYDLFQSRLEAAATVGDALALADIRHEYDDLDTHLTAARVRLLTLRIERAEAQAPAAKAAVHATGGVLQQIDEELAAVQARRTVADQAHYVARMDVDTLGREIADCRRQRADLLAALTAVPAPVVRSLPHASAVVRNGQ